MLWVNGYVSVYDGYWIAHTTWKIQVLKPTTNIFELKMLVKCCLEFFIWNFTGQIRADLFVVGSSNSEGATRISKQKKI